MTTRVTYGMRDTLQLIRKDDNDALFRTAAAGAGMVVLSKLTWVVPIVPPNDVLKVNLCKSVATNNTIPVASRRRQRETFTLPQARFTVWRLGVSSAPEKLRWALVGLQTGNSGNQDRNAASFDHFNLTNMQVRLIHSRYPTADTATDFVKELYVGVYKSFHNFASRYYGIDNLLAASQVNPAANKALNSIYVFDVSKQSEQLTEGVVDLTVKMEFSANVPAGYTSLCLGYQ